jgi:glycine hydroxymethyltransferase
MQPEFKHYQQLVLDNARAMGEVFMRRGYAVVSGGTDNHLMLVSLVNKGLTGKDVEAALGEAAITVNKNSVPDDPQSPFVTSGIRVGTPAISTRGFDENDVRKLTGWMCDIMDDLGNTDVIAGIRAKVADLCARHPVYAR